MGQPTVYSGIGRCIYCGESDCTLTNEHIIPYGLGGNVILTAASCSTCATATSQFEQSCLRGMLGTFRACTGLPSRSRKNTPKTLPIRTVGADGTPVDHEVKIDSVPEMLVLPRLSDPHLLRGLPPEGVFRQANFWHFVSDDEYLRKRLAQGDKAMQVGNIHLGEFARLLAKIAHSAAIAIRGADSFAPMLLDLIRFNTGSASYLVGGDFHTIPPAEQRLHRLDLHVYRYSGTDYLIATIRLFANFGAPIYHVVVGEWIGHDPSEPV